jgi:hypothetical protein
MLLGRRRILVVASSALAVALVSFLVILLGGVQALQDRRASLAATQELGSLTIVSILDGDLAGEARYRISPDPFTGNGNYTVRDGDVSDADGLPGIITIQGVPDGTYSVIQLEGPEGQQRDIIPRIITVDDSRREAVTFIQSPPDAPRQNPALPSLEELEGIVYAAKFECGTIDGREGPLRPGHYDTDIGIFNKQSFPVKVTWTAAENDKGGANAILKTIAEQTSTSIVCADIRAILGGEDEFVEGFVVVEVPVDPIFRASIGSGASVLGSSSYESLDVLDVQAFYTANALEELPHPVLMDKISFVITVNGTVEGLPESMIGKLLDVTLPSEVGKVSEPSEKVKLHLLDNFSLTEQDLSMINIEVRSIDVGVGTMIDDHAVSLSKVQPQAKVG